MLKKIHQLSTFIENKIGRLAAVTDVLAKNDINIHAMSVYDSTEFNIFRFITDEPYKALEMLKKEGYVVRMTEVVVVEPLDKPGTMNRIFHLLADNNISINYLYPYAVTDAPYMLVMSTTNKDKTIELIRESGLSSENE